MSEEGSRLTALWRAAAEDLGLEIITPFELRLPSGRLIPAHVLVRKFGAREGMLVISDDSLVWSCLDEIERAGHGFSTMSEPRAGDTYERGEFVAILSDWGWSGGDASRPEWLEDLDDDPA